MKNGVISETPVVSGRFHGLKSRIMADLQLQILGDFALTRDGENLSVGGAKQQALLAYLALQNGQPVAREVLAGLLWGERFEQQARQSLRQALYRLKQSLDKAAADILELSDTAAGLFMNGLSVDALEFVTQAEDDPAKAAALYQPLMQGLSALSPAFEEWLTTERARFADLAGDVYDRLSATQMTDEPLVALTSAEAWITLDPLNEAAHCRAMEIEIAKGERTAALKRYKALSEILQKELGVEPDAESRSLADRARQNEAESGGASSPEIFGHGVPVVAVLPFENLSGDPEQDFFAAGITDEIIAALALSSERIILSRNVAEDLIAQGLGLYAVARELGARYTIQGGVRRAGERLRVMAQLIDTEDDRQIWAQRFEGGLAEVFDFQDEIVRHTANAINQTTLSDEIVKMQRRKATSPDAYDFYLRAIASPQAINFNYREAIIYLDQALAIDPGFIPAINESGFAHVLMARLRTAVTN